jgi:DNA-binding NarL/FixJ family response regulator
MPQNRNAAVLIFTHRLAWGEMIQGYLEDSERLRPVLLAVTRKEALSHLRSGTSDVALLDPEHPAVDMFLLGKKLGKRQPPCQVIFLCSTIAEGWVQRALEVGAAGLLASCTAAADLGRAIRAVRKGQRYFGPGIATVVSELASPKSRVPSLSKRERQILQLICLGQTTKEIALDLSLAPKTVDEIRYEMMLKTGTTRATQLVRYACAERLVDFTSRWERIFSAHEQRRT